MSPNPKTVNVALDRHISTYIDQHMGLLGYRSKTAFVQAAIVHYIAATIETTDRIQALRDQTNNNSQPR